MKLPHANERIDDWLARRTAAGRMLLALDFDGTLAPIVPRPEDATIDAAARAALRRLSGDARTTVAIVSGRGLADARERVGIDGIYFAGNHGLEIEGPDLHREHEQARAARPALERCAERLLVELADVAGIIIEDKGLTYSVHFRLVATAAARDDVIRRVRAACGAEPGIRLTEGKMVVEIRPDVDWDKGRAVDFLLDTLFDDARDVLVLFIGDDRTDEDAFRALSGRGEGVIVADPLPATTAASAFVHSPSEVVTLLERLADGA